MTSPVVVNGYASWRATPGFVESLRLLIERERYSLTDIGLMFNVSRERVRQWCRYHDIEHPSNGSGLGLNCVRVWNDGTHRFEPVGRGNFGRRQAERRRKERERRRAEREADIVARVSAAGRTLGRRPSWVEVYRALTGSTLPQQEAGPRALALWPTQRGRRISTAEFWRRCGFEPPGSGNYVRVPGRRRSR